MKQGLIVAVGGVAIVAAALAGCSGDKDKSASSDKGSTVSASAGAVNTKGTTKVVVDGQEQKVEGAIVCSSMGGNTNIAIGNGTQGIAVVLSDGDSPTVQSVGLGHINGAMLGYTAGAPGGDAKATKDGKNYKVTGNATGTDMANPTSMVTKSFEIDVTCP